LTAIPLRRANLPQQPTSRDQRNRGSEALARLGAERPIRSIADHISGGLRGCTRTDRDTREILLRRSDSETIAAWVQVPFRTCLGSRRVTGQISRWRFGTA
jgi:hypothetical protein